MPKRHSYCKTREPKNRGRVWKRNEPLSHSEGFEHFNQTLFYLPNILCYGGEEGICISLPLCCCSGFTCFARRWGIATISSLHVPGCGWAPRLDSARERNWWKTSVLPSVACKTLLPQFRTGGSYPSCPLSKLHFAALPNNPAAKATDESEERRLMQYTLSLSTGVFGFFPPFPLLK